MAAINTLVAATIGVLKGLGLPDKKDIERTKLQRLIERIKMTTKKYRIGIDVDANTEAADLRKILEETEDSAEISGSSIGTALQGGMGAAKQEYKKI